MRLRAGGSFPAGGLSTTINIRSGSPTGTVRGTATTFVPGPVSAGTQLLVDFDFDPSLTIFTGFTHVIEWITVGDAILTWMGTSADVYAGGNAFGCSAGAIPTRDHNFKTVSR